MIKLIFLLTFFVSVTLQSLKNDLKDNMKMLNITYLISHYSKQNYTIVNLKR